MERIADSKISVQRTAFSGIVKKEEVIINSYLIKKIEVRRQNSEDKIKKTEKSLRATTGSVVISLGY